MSGRDKLTPFAGLVAGKNILVTGGTGTVGYELVRALLPLAPKVVRIFSRDEQKQFHLRNEFRYIENVRFLIGDVRDLDRLKRAMENVDIVFHLAALKHVESCEYNPFEAIKTNVTGTQNVIDAALTCDVDRVVFSSSDKAVNPSNAMGASKLMAEKLMVAGQFAKGARDTRFSSVRFGNVLGSSGSVIPTFVHRIRTRQPIEITHADMTRFVLGFRDCCELLLTTARDAAGGEIFVRKMPVVRIVDLADALVEELAGLYGLPGVDVRIVGARAGEKLYEELVTEEESARTVDIGEHLVVLPQIGTRPAQYANAAPIPAGAYSSRTDAPIDKAAIRRLLIEDGTLTNPNLLHGMRTTPPIEPEGEPGSGFMETFNAG
ncbi:polysaccharide biosynthesis protein [bacterium]|nr:polysaccharide biosynthesis protein [bacterium]